MERAFTRIFAGLNWRAPVPLEKTITYGERRHDAARPASVAQPVDNTNPRRQSLRPGDRDPHRPRHGLDEGRRHAKADGGSGH